MKSIIFPNHILIPEIKKLIDQGHTTTFKVKGFSMRLFLENDRDKVILAPVLGPLKKYDVILAEIKPGIYVLHRIIRINGNEIILQGDGNIGTIEKCTLQNVIGIAKGFYRKDRSHPDMVTGLKWRIYSKIWLTLTPFRRIILGIYRRLPIRI